MPCCADAFGRIHLAIIDWSFACVPPVTLTEAESIKKEKRKLIDLIRSLGRGIARTVRRFEGFLYAKRFWLIVLPTILAM